MDETHWGILLKKVFCIGDDHGGRRIERGSPQGAMHVYMAME
jgi:hypothetical protein